MATFTSTSGSYTTTLTVTQTSQSTQNNQSTLTYSLTLTKNSGTGLWNNNSCPWSITIDGSTVASGSFTYDFRSYSSLTLKGSTTTTVTHNSDGTKTVACSASVNMDNEPYVYIMKPSGDLALTTIPRASDVSVSNYSIANTSGSISATITSKASFYHKWRWRMNSGSWSSWTNKGLIASTSSTVTVANTTLLAQLPTATSGSFNIEVATYSDSGYATLVGTKSASATVSVNTANIKPTVTLADITINSTSITGYAVAGYSSLKDTFTTTNSSGATSVTTYFSISNASLTSTSSTSTSGTVTTNTLPQNTSNYTVTISAYAKDSRGATSSTVSKAFGVWGYTPPTATLNAYRVASSSSTTEDGAGTYAYVTFSGAVGASVNNQNTIQSTSCTYSGSISGTATNGGHYALSDTQTVTFTLTVRDKVTSVTTSKTINTATYPLDLYDNGSGSVGVGLGTVAVAGFVKSIMPIRVNNSDSLGYVELREDGEGGTIDISSKNGKVFEIDAFNDNALRCFAYDDGGNFVTCDFNRTTGVFYSSGGFYGSLTGNADTATSATSATTANSLTPTQLTNQNLNDIAPANTTFYYAGGSNTVLNTPFASGTAFGLFVYRNAGGFRVQDIISLNGDKWVRYYNSNSASWSDWRMIPQERVIWTGTAQADTGSPLSLSTAGYKRVRVYFNSYSTQGTFEIDLEHTTTQIKYTGWPYRGSGSVTPINAANTALQIHFCDCRISTNKDSFYVDKMGYCTVGNATVNFQASSPNYYVYKIVGIV